MDKKDNFRIVPKNFSSFAESKDSHKYYNITLVNKTNNPLQASYLELRSDAVLPNPEQYHMSIERFDIPCSYLPLQIVETFPGITGSSGQDFTINYTGTLTPIERGNVVSPQIPDYTGINGQVPVGLSNSIAYNDEQGNFTTTDPSYAYYYETMIECMNFAIADAENWMIANAPTYTADFTPFFSYNANSQLITLNAPQQYNLNITGAPKLQWGALTQYYLQSIPVKYSNQQDPASNCCTAKIYPRGGPESSQLNGWQKIQTPNTLTPTYFTGICVTQEWPCLENFQYPKTLQFLTNTIPVTLQDINNQNLGTVYDPSSLIFTNFDIPLGTDSRSVVQFYIQGERRLIDLNGNQPLKQMSWNLYWSDQLQNLIPVYIPPYQSIGVLVQFIKKGHYQ